MATQAAIDIIAGEDSEAWQKFRMSEVGTIDLSRIRIENRSLQFFDFSNCNLDDAIFDDCSLNSAKFDRALLRRSRFRKCDLFDVNFDQVDLTGSYFDGCELYNTDFENAYGLETRSIEMSYGDLSTGLPDDVMAPSAWDDFFIDETSLEESTDNIPQVPNRVFAPVETEWENDRLVLRNYPNSDILSLQVRDKLVKSLNVSLVDLIAVLSRTNFDQRLVREMTAVADDFPKSAADFGREIFDIWFRMRPAFEYAHMTKGQHSDFLEAKMLSFEMSFRDALNSYEEFREYQTASNSLKITAHFNDQIFIQNQIQFASDLAKMPEFIDRTVPIKLKEVASTQKIAAEYGTFKSVVYGSASSVANVLSRFMQIMLQDIASGVSDGVKSGIKSVVSAVIVGSGGTLMWMLTTGLDAFPWLRRAWEFVRNSLNL